MILNISFGGLQICQFVMLFDSGKCYITIIIFVMSFLNIRCKKKEYIDDSYFGSKIMILGHRGMGVAYSRPGNTFEAISPVIGIGADGSEMDVQLSKDSVLVLFHDQNMTTETFCSGRVYEKDWSEIKKCKYSSLLQYNIYVNSVDELFCKIPNLNTLYFSFDCKVDNDVKDKTLYIDQFLRGINKVCEKYSMSNNVFVEGDLDFLRRAQKLGLTNKLFLTGELNESTISAASSNHFFGISTSIDYLHDNVLNAHQRGLFVMTWSPNNFSQNKIALSNKVDIIQTDDPMSILKIFNRYNYEYTLP
jgi:glycerophosphoryl diester phosphodiesterase